jgi:hypothetical protein
MTAAPSKSNRGIQRLAGPIFVQVVQDTRAERGRSAREAFSRMMGAGSHSSRFSFCCRILRRNPEKLRSGLLQKSSGLGRPAQSNQPPVTPTQAAAR